MAYLLLLVGLVLCLMASRQLVQKKKISFDDSLRTEVDRPLNCELVTLYELQGSVEDALQELDEKNQVFNHLVSRLEKQRETIDFRLQQMERLIGRTEAVLNNPPGRNDTQTRRFQHEQVYSLYDQGLEVADVALKLGIGRGEVELILGLRK
jgi:hypothetical protein